MFAHYLPRGPSKMGLGRVDITAQAAAPLAVPVTVRKNKWEKLQLVEDQFIMLLKLMLLRIQACTLNWSPVLHRRFDFSMWSIPTSHF